jgi:hypothetical protein
MGRRVGPTLRERALAAAATPDPAVRHCWVADADGSLDRRPGLLLEWRHDGADGWSGLVAYVPKETASGARLVQQWLPAVHLTARP